MKQGAKILIGLLVFFFCINHNSFAADKEMIVLVRMMDIQDKFFRSTIIPEAEKKFGVKLRVVTFDKLADIETMVNLEKRAGKKSIGLIKTELTEIHAMVRLNNMMALEDIVSVATLKKDMAEYVDCAVEYGTINKKVYYIPRKLETNVFLFLKSKLRDAVANWTSMRKEINNMFKKHNGYGLPADYDFEADPNKWDWFDLAVFSYYWAHTKGPDCLTIPRMAHRGKDYGGTTVELLTKIFQAGGTADDFLALNTNPVLDMFEWEAFYVDNGLYNPSMWEQSWSGGGIWKGFADGQVYAAFMHQIDAFFIHGGTDRSLSGYLVDSDDMSSAIMPKGVSIQLNSNGKPVRVGKHASQFSGWWWGIPVTSPYPEISYKLARFITSKKIHAMECAKFGMMPIRKDIFDNLKKTFKVPWMRTVFDTASAQYKAGVEQIPIHKNYPAMASLLRKAWFDIVTKKRYSANGDGVDRDYISDKLEPFVEKMKTLK